MNQLIVVPRIVNTVGDWYQFPMGIAYISSCLRHAGFNVSLINLNNIHGSVGDILKKEILEHDIEVVMTGGVTGQYGAIKEIFETAQLVREDIITVAGGGIITSAPEHAMEALEFSDYGVIGEGEDIICELCRTFEENGNIEDVAGIVYKDGDSFKRTAGKVSSVDVKKLPLPDYEGMGVDKLLSSVPNIIGMSEYNTLPIVTSRSCPYQCTFCFHTSGRKFRQRDLDSVFEEVEYLIEKYNVQYLSILDELFGHKMERVEEFCRRMKKYNIRWLAQFRVNDITPELVKLLKESNCATVGLGIESADNRILKSMKKRIKIEETERALKLLYDGGIGIQGVLIFGDVAETLETATNSIEWWKKNIHYELQLSAIITYPGTEIYTHALANGTIKDPVQFIKDGCPLVRLSKMSDAEYNWLFQQLASLPRMTHQIPNKTAITNIDFKNSSIDLTGYCVSCNTENKFDKIRLFILETLTCINCGKKHIAPIPEEIVNRINDNVDRLVEKYSELAFWGYNSYFFNLAGKINKNKQTILVDKSDVRCGLDVSGYTVQNSDVLDSQGIKCVIVTVVQYFAGLKTPIADEYKSVEQVLSISDLLSENIINDIGV